jgi:hypothetical protein
MHLLHQLRTNRTKNLSAHTICPFLAFSCASVGLRALATPCGERSEKKGVFVMQTPLSILALSAVLAIPSLAAAQGASLHGFDDVSFKNDYITPRGLVVTTHGSTVQALDGLVVDIPLDPKAFINDLSWVGGIWSDWNPHYDPSRNKEVFNEFDWFFGPTIALGKDWKLGGTIGQFISPQQAFKTETNLEFTLNFNDSNYLKTLTFSPYIKLFYNLAGSSTVVVGKTGGSFDIELGASPSLDLHRYKLPLIVSVPTWLTVGPSDFWGGGGSVGVFATGVKLTYPITAIPAAAGHWALYGSYQYYNLINDRLVLAESLLNGKTDRGLSVFSIGINLGF